MRKVSNRSWFRNFAHERSSSGSAMAERFLGLPPGSQRLLLVAHIALSSACGAATQAAVAGEAWAGTLSRAWASRMRARRRAPLAAGYVAAVGQGARGHGRVAVFAGRFDGGVVQVPGGAWSRRERRRTSLASRLLSPAA